MFWFVILFLGIAGLVGAASRAGTYDRQRALPPPRDNRAVPPDPVEPPPRRADAPPGHTVLTMHPGVELFLPAKPHGELFMLEILGEYSYKASGFCQMDHSRGRADALWATAETPNFLTRYHGLHVDGERIEEGEPFSADREEHRYVFAAGGDGKKHGLLLEAPIKPVYPIGHTLTVTLRPPSAHEQLILDRLAATERAAQARALEEAEETKREREEQERREREQREREELEVIAARLATQAERLAKERALVEKRAAEQEAAARAREEQARAEVRRLLQHEHDLRGHLYTSDTFIENYARKYQQVMKTLRPEIEREYREFIGDRALIEHLEAEAPHLITFRTWRMRALTKMEEFDVMPPQSAPPPRFTPPTTEQYRERLLQRPQVEFKDVLALHKAKTNARHQMLEVADTIEDEEEREQWVVEMTEEINRIYARRTARRGEGSHVDYERV